MNLPQPGYELGNMTYYLVYIQFRIIKSLFLFKVIFYGSTDVGSRHIEHRIATKHPFFLGDIVISDLSGKLEYSIKYPPMNGGQSSYGKGKRTLIQ